MLVIIIIIIFIINKMFLCLDLATSELGDTVAMSPVDRMKSLNLKLVSLGRIYTATPRYFPLGRNSTVIFSSRRGHFSLALPSASRVLCC